MTFTDLPEETFRAANIYEKAGQPDMAALLLEKVAKVLEDQQPTGLCWAFNVFQILEIKEVVFIIFHEKYACTCG